MKDISKEYGSHDLMFSYFKRELQSRCPKMNDDNLNFWARELTYKYDQMLDRGIDEYVSENELDEA
ncbi:hypothetical protein SAMN02745945_02955 [Peptoclostridium litorale DSM 5388]|uniref:Uncharacterized protein n=1 Tax=Peptoclostridium litorale DSM 5388 TaxID=1121324 RepID=A0A069RL26_PEPLI|nr:hypothetical protein [Peptoclostridium litorale]KDR96815.1 hypothetical protein CLIT_20p00280 [Peptoclostridium litorale DSM 5388]SIO36481.1 hypothetical protein SAMN02745945_02955 [Peptoclostridium litorale DSM 5388]